MPPGGSDHLPGRDLLPVMRIDSITLDFWRNYPHAELSFSPGVNVFYGENAQGKTNLLEAVAYLSCAKSHRARYDRELICHGVDHAFIKGEVWDGRRQVTLEAKLQRQGRRQLLANGVRLKTAAELSDSFKTVLFCPEDLFLVKAGAAERRRFFDECISQLRPRYAVALAEYKKLYEHKTRILRDWSDKPDLLDALDDFSLRMAQTGAVVIHYRAHFVRQLALHAPAIHSQCSGGRETLELGYKTVSTIPDPLAGRRAILEGLLEHQQTHRQAELEARQCLSGPHKDDLLLTIDGQTAKEYASQGQTRTAALALKLGARELCHADSGHWPVLLLDDVLSELDARRREFVLERIQGGQVFITCCEEGEFPTARKFRVSDGRVVK